MGEYRLDARTPWAASSAIVAALVAAFAAANLVSSLAVAAVVVLAALTLLAVKHPKRWVVWYAVAATVVPALPVPFINATAGLSDALVLAGVFAALASGRRKGSKASGLVLSLSLLLTVQVISILASPFGTVNSNLEASLRWSRSAGALVVAAFAGKFTWSRVELKHVAKVLLLAALASNGITILQFLTQADWLVRTQQAAWADGARFLRGSGIFGEPNMAGAFASFSALLGIGYGIGASSRLGKALAQVSVVVALGALACSASRGALLSFTVGLALVLARARSRVIVGVSAAVLVAAGLALLGDNATLSYLIGRLQTLPVVFGPGGSAVTGGRLEHWTTLVRMAQSYPLLGVGFKLLAYSPAAAVGITVSDNNLVMALVETGWLGLAATAWLMVVLVRRAVQLFRSADPVAVAVSGALVGFVLQGMGVDTLTYWRLTAVLFGFAELLVRNQEAGV